MTSRTPRRDISMEELFPNDEDTPPPLRELPADVTPPVEKYPLAERTENPNQVLSPYAPYNTIDITGFKPGALARDPSNQQIFRVP